jgi:hypothetical protein
MARSHESLWLAAAGTCTAVAVALLGTNATLDAVRPHYAFWTTGLMMASYGWILLAAVCFAGALRQWRAPLAGERDTVTGSAISPPSPVNEVSPFAGTGKPVRIGPRPAFLVGREDMLDEVEARLYESQGEDLKIVTLTGLGGVGKTSLALEFAYRHLHESGIVWQFAAEEATTLSAQFGELSDLLGMAGTGDPVARVHGMLATIQSQWLLIFDNARDEQALQNLVPPAGNGRIIITSQNPNWTRGRAIAVSALNIGTAAGFLLQRTGSTNEHAARQLAGELGGLPLALEQACAFMAQTGHNISDYLAMFLARRSDLLKRGKPANYDRQVATTWSLAFDQIQKYAPRGIGLLRVLACCAPENIPVRLLLHDQPGLGSSFTPKVASLITPLLKDSLELDDAIAALRSYSLIVLNADETASVHRLVQAITLDAVAVSQVTSWREATATLIRCALPADPQDPANWQTYNLLLPHAEAALPVSDNAVSNIVSCLGYEGHYALACELSMKIIRAREQILGVDHPDTLKERASLALWTGEAGDPSTARDQAAALLPDQDRVLGPEHPDSLATRSLLTRWIGTANDPVKARDQFAELLPIRERVLGADHPDTLATRASLATWTGHSGDPAAARHQFAQLLPIRERVLGADHPDTLATRANIAYWTGIAGDPVGARDQFAELLPIRQRVLGPDHPDTLTSRVNLARWTGIAGDPTGARDQLAELLPIRERVLGPDHPDTLATRRSLAEWTKTASPDSMKIRLEPSRKNRAKTLWSFFSK